MLERRVSTTDIKEGPERPGSGQDIALSDHDPRRGATVLDEMAQKRCLADSCLAYNQGNAAVLRGRVMQSLTQGVEDIVSLQEVHD